MCDECDDVEEDTTVPGTVWHDAGGGYLHWTDAFIFTFKVLEELGNVVRRIGDFGGQFFKAHANEKGRRKAVGVEMLEDIERITGER